MSLTQEAPTASGARRDCGWRPPRRVGATVIALLVVGGTVGPSQPAGAARVEIRGERLYMDGERFLVKGVGYSPSRPGQVPWKDAVDRETMARDFVMIRAAGFNTIRTWSPLSPEELALAEAHGLAVLQGVWVDPDVYSSTEAIRRAMEEIVRREAQRAASSDNVLALLVGNELSPERTAQLGLRQTNQLFHMAYQAAKAVDPNRVVSHANWPKLSALDGSMWDLLAFNVYPYEPASVSHTFGFRGYLEHLTRTVGQAKPVIISEVGLSASPEPGPRPGYGGYSPDAQARELLTLWDLVFQAGTQGGSVFEWNDEWWKQDDYAGDERVHDPNDPEEWFGITAFQGPDQTEPEPRPVYDALRRYNQAILVEPVSEQPYAGWLPVSVYTTDAVARVRVRLGWGWWWQDATQESPHWWTTRVQLRHSWFPRRIRLVMEALDAQGQVLVRRDRQIQVGPPEPPLTVTIDADRDRYDVVDNELQSIRFRINVLDAHGQPVAGQRVAFSISEPQVEVELTHTKRTDNAGHIEGAYLVQEPGLVTIAAATVPARGRPDRRHGAERSVVVTRRRTGSGVDLRVPHQPSSWERRVADVTREALRHSAPAFQLAQPGTERIVDYSRYGRFHGIGTAAYHYEILDRDGLAAAVGEGIYPNEGGLLEDPAYRQALLEDRLEGNVWDMTYHEDPQLSFLKWASTFEESGGVKQFFTALALERAGLWQAAVTAYYAIAVHFPGAVGRTEFDTPWYIGLVAMDKIEAILRLHPELGLRLTGARVVVGNGFDNDVDNDEVIAYPGQLVSVAPEDQSPPATDLSTLPIQRELGQGRVRVRQYANGHWQLVVDGEPWTIRGIVYQPSAVGESPDEETLQDWMTADRNGNGRLDGPSDTFVDRNRNNRQDDDEPTVGDIELLQAMGVNTLRLYHHASNKPLLRALYEQSGIMVLMGDLVGMYTVGSGADWLSGTDYLDPVQRRRMTKSVQQMVREFKDEPYILMWVLGNENNYGGVHGIIGGEGNAAEHPEEFYGFLNELAEWIHQEDPDHPVAIANGEWLFLDQIAAHAPAIDVFGANVYRGWHGFGRSFFEAVQRLLDRPVFISEFGCPAYQAGRSREVAELDQALYHFGNWVDIEDNLAGRGVGNVLGGVVFEWNDEWWKAGQPPRFSPDVQETVPNWSGPFPDGKNYEEWLGITSQGDGSLSPYARQLRPSYRLYQQLWKD